VREAIRGVVSTDGDGSLCVGGGEGAGVMDRDDASDRSGEGVGRPCVALVIVRYDREGGDARSFCPRGGDGREGMVGRREPSTEARLRDRWAHAQGV
jgi:hypothetical protein